MEIIKLNETPVRTSRNFNINNIKFEDVIFPENVPDFTGLQVLGDCKVEKNASISKLKFGLGDIAYNNIVNNVNNSIKISGSSAKLIYAFDDANNNLINYIGINAEQDMNIVIEYSSDTNQKCFANSIITLNANKEVKVNITFINLLNELSDCFVAINNNIDEKAIVNYGIIDLGARRSVQNYYSNICGSEAINNLNSIYLGNKEQIKDLNYIAELYGKKSIVDINVQGALQDNAKKNFKGTIDFKKGCKKSKGDENEYCMLLSDRAKSIALPMLLCTEDDVEGNHATASGKLDDKEIFYIMSRGFSKKEATKLIVKGKFNNIIEKVEDEETRNKIIYEIDRRLN